MANSRAIASTVAQPNDTYEELALHDHNHNHKKNHDQTWATFE
jgi:hypothetical protein